MDMGVMRFAVALVPGISTTVAVTTATFAAAGFVGVDGGGDVIVVNSVTTTTLLFRGVAVGLLDDVVEVLVVDVDVNVSVGDTPGAAATVFAMINEVEVGPATVIVSSTFTETISAATVSIVKVGAYPVDQ
jgi:hypothetical protein